MTLFVPTDIAELREAVAGALAAEEAVELVGGGSKRDIGRPLQTPHVLDLSRLAGIRDYAPNELVLTAGAATPLAEIEAALAQHNQMLAFEPPDWRGLLGSDAAPTLGGALACNLAGPRRIKAGAARDHFLGFRGVSGRGEIFKAGGKVVKNVTGYDLCKLMAGSFGTLAAIEEVTVKVLPRPETEATVMLAGISPETAPQVMAAALGSPHDVSAAAYVPDGYTEISPRSVVLRVEGPSPSVVHRREAVRDMLAAGISQIFIDRETSLHLWEAIGDASPLWPVKDRAVWRVSVVPSRGVAVAETVARAIDANWFLDWGGGLLWLSVPEEGDGGAAVIRAAITGADGASTGHATLIKGSPALRRAVPVFEPQPAALAALSRRVKDAFDPAHILNPGRMYEDV
jgi:glycolate oxidase FAD binding subunit